MPILMNKDKKTAVRVILGKMGQGTESGGTGYKKEKEIEGPSSDTKTAKDGTMQKFLTAVEAKDTGSMAAALEAFFSLCDGDEEDVAETGEYGE